MCQGPTNLATPPLRGVAAGLAASRGVSGKSTQFPASYAQAEQAKKSATDFAANEFNQLKVPYENEMTTLLNQGSEKLKTQTQESLQQKTEMEKTLSDRQAWINATFQKGKAAHQG